MKKILTIVMSLFMLFSQVGYNTVIADDQQPIQEPDKGFEIKVVDNGDIVIEIPDSFKNSSAIVFQGIMLLSVDNNEYDCWFQIPQKNNGEIQNNYENDNYAFSYNDAGDLVYSTTKQKELIIWNNDKSKVLVNGEKVSFSLQWGYPNNGNTFYEEYKLDKVTLTGANKVLDFDDNFTVSFTKSKFTQSQNQGENDTYEEAYISIKSISNEGDNVLEELINRDGKSDTWNNRYVSIVANDVESKVENYNQYDASKEYNNQINIYSYDNEGTQRKEVRIKKNYIYGLTSTDVKVAIRIPGYSLSNYSSTFSISDSEGVIPSNIEFAYENTNEGLVFKVTADNTNNFLNNFNIELKKETSIENPFGNTDTERLDIRLERLLFTEANCEVFTEQTVETKPDKTVAVPNGTYDYKIYYLNSLAKSGTITISGQENDKLDFSFDTVASQTEGKKDFVISSTNSALINNVQYLNVRDANGNSFEMKYEDKQYIKDSLTANDKITIAYDDYSQKQGNENPNNSWYSSTIVSYEQRTGQGGDGQGHTWIEYYSNLQFETHKYKYIDNISNKISFPNFNSNVAKGTKIKDAIKALPEQWEVWYEGDVTPETKVVDEVQVKIAYRAYPIEQKGEGAPKVIDNTNSGNELYTEEKDGYVYFVGTVHFQVEGAYSAVADDPEAINLWSYKAELKGSNKPIDLTDSDSTLEAAVEYLNNNSTGTIKLQEDITISKDVKLYHKFSDYDYNEHEYIDALVINLNGHKLTLADNSKFTLETNNNQNVVVIKNGEIEGNNDSLFEITCNQNILVLSDITITNNSDNVYSSVIYNNSGLIDSKDNVKLNSNGFGLYFEKKLVYNDWEHKYYYEAPGFVGHIDIESYNDCICYDDPDNFNSEYGINGNQLLIGDWQNSSLISNLNSTNGCIIYYDDKGDFSNISLLNVIGNSKYGIMIDSGCVQVSGSKLTNAEGAAVTTNATKDIEFYCDTSTIITPTNVVKDETQTGSTSKITMGFYSDSIHQSQSVKPFDVDLTNFECDFVLFNKDVKSYLPQNLISEHLFKDVFRNQYDPEEVMYFGSEKYMYFLHLPFGGDDADYLKIVTNKNEFLAAIANDEVTEIVIDTDSLNNKTLDLSDSGIINITSAKNINLNGATIKTAGFNASVVASQNGSFTRVNFFGTIDGSKSKIIGTGTVLNVKNSDIGLYGVDITNTEGYLIKCSDYAWIDINEKTSLIGENGIEFKNGATSNYMSGIYLSNEALLKVADKAVVADEDSAININVEKDSKIESTNGNAIEINTKTQGNTSYIEILGEVVASGRAISLLKAEAYVNLRKGSISGSNAIYINTSLLHTVGIDIKGGKLTGTEDTIKQEGLFAPAGCMDESFLYVKGGKFKCGTNDEYKIFNCKLKNKVRVYGGQFSKDIGSDFECIKQNVGGTKTYIYKCVQTQSSGEYPYAMARKLPTEEAGSDQYNIMDAVSIEQDVVVDAESLATVATGGSSGSSIIMKVDEQDNSSIINEFTYDQDKQELTGTYDIGIVKNTGSLTNVTETTKYQSVSIAANGINRETFKLFHKHGTNDPVQIFEVTAEDAAKYLSGEKTYDGGDSFYYFSYSDELEELMINIVTKKFSTFAFVQDIVFDAATCGTPVRKLDLVANGTSQELIEAISEVKGGTVVYSLDGQTWSEDIPTGVDAQEYTVYYKVSHDTTHSDSEVKSIKVSIAAPATNGKKHRHYDDNPVVDTIATVINKANTLKNSVKEVIENTEEEVETVTNNEIVEQNTNDVSKLEIVDNTNNKVIVTYIIVAAIILGIIAVAAVLIKKLINSK